MILDKTLELSLAQAVTATALSTNVIDMASARNIGGGEGLFLYIRVGAAAAAAGAATVNFQLQTDSSPAMGAAVTVLDSGAIPKAALAANTALKFRLPSAAFKQFLALNYQVATGPLTAGDFSAWICSDVPDNTQYSGGYVVG
ncbi:Bbp16 family capsid cement protein [Geobacter sp. AOG2]|uniref:Bbp16 family capsid cement protein n=1 Tax=Geobacter sp. AOG2 TaxID=1566347 RepID=UPI001CC52625|nr:hypothetical protein [Geobacter sp. AOG2]GFE61930.1 hypothetical protein AOG2_25180 [Geobacter sp. AOG2]